MKGGYMGKILRVNLTTKTISNEKLKEDLTRIFVGGVGTAARILYDEVPPWVAPLDPANRLIFSTGPVTGTIAPTAGRHTVVAKSPLTGYFGDANAGGLWGAELKFAGYDMIVVTGRSDSPVYLWVHDDQAEIKDATSYWGMNAREADRAIRRDLGDVKVRVADIGQAGENLVRYAAVMNDEANRTAARCGLGAVMGFMKLKAVAVRGHKTVPIADEKRFQKVVSKVRRLMQSDADVKSLGKGGTPDYFLTGWELGDVPAYNWSRGDFGGPGDPYVEKIAYPGGYEEILSGRRACFNCPIGCRRVAKVKNVQYAIEDGAEGPEYETQAALGSNCGISNIKAIAKVNDLCNLYGIDTISAGSTIAFAMECCERGIISKEWTEGMDVKFGDDLATIEIIHMIAFRKGFGNILAEGSRRAAAIIGRGSERYAIQVKGMDIAMHDPRAFQAGGPHYACSPTGGRHTEANPILFFEATGRTRPDLGYPKRLDRFSTKGKGRVAKIMEDWWAFIAAAGWCIFADFAAAYGVENFREAYNALTGFNNTTADIMKAGERIYNLKKAFNMRHGCSREEDNLPDRLLKEKTKAGAVVKLDKTLPQYFRVRGWDPKTSKPTKKKLLELGLRDVAEDLWP